MLRRTRVGTTPDLARLSQGMQRPGIDPRVWASIAIALDEEFFDEKHGCFVEVRLLPNGEELTCYVPQAYTGGDFGEHQQTIHKDDQLFIAVPNGDPAEGGVVLTRFHSLVDKPPQLAKENPDDYVRVQETDTSWRLKLQGNGQWLFEGADDVLHKTTKKYTIEAETVTAKTEKVRLGAEGASQQLIFGTKHRAQQKTMHQGLMTDLAAAAAQLVAANVAINVAASSLTTAGPLTLLPPAGVAITAAGTGLQTAATAISGTATQLLNAVAKIAAFEASGPPDDYLSNVSKTT